MVNVFVNFNAYISTHLYLAKLYAVKKMARNQVCS
jgi:hypothetical protein